MVNQQITPRIKICGLTTVDDALAAVELGVDAIGIVFYAASPRAVSVTRAKEIAHAVGPFVTVVGLFVDAGAREINTIVGDVPLQVLQFHGEETAEFCVQFHRPWIKALRMKPGVDVKNYADRYASGSGILLDSYKPGVPGGTGDVFDWRSVPDSLNVPVILAGGLNADNVASAVDQVRPYAVDVSGGVESAPGKKDRQKMKNFIDAVRKNRGK